MDSKITGDYNLNALVASISKHLQAASLGQTEDTSISWYETKFDSAIANTDKAFTALVIGGSFLKQAVIDGETRQIIGEVKRYRLGVYNSGRELLEEIAAMIEISTELLLINFAYPLTSFTNKYGMIDGKLEVENSKENNFSDLVGLGIAEQFVEVYKSINPKSPLMRAGAVNDTVALCLAGRNAGFVGDSEPLVDLVIGTGFNMGISQNATSVVNLELGLFAPDSDADILEKSISGRYLLELYNAKLTDPSQSVGDAKEVSKLASAGDELAISVLHNSTANAAAAIAAVRGFLLTSENQQSPLTIVAEGGVFWDAYNYKESVLHHLANYHKISIAEIDTLYTFKQIENSDLLGLAGAVNYYSS